LRKGFKRISIPEDIENKDITIDLALELLKQR